MATPGPKVARARGGCGDVYLVIDDRERHVAPHIEMVCLARPYMVHRLRVGDFMHCRAAADRSQPPKILANVERKTLIDFAASFKDDRYGNLEKQLQLRRDTGCQLWWVVEGKNAFPDPTTRYGRIPYTAIQSAMDHMRIRHGVQVLLTRDEMHTAQRMVDLLESYATVPPEYAIVPVDLAAAAPAAAAIAAAFTDASAEAAAAVAAAAAPLPDILAAHELAPPDPTQGHIEQSDEALATAMWSTLRGISAVLGRLLTREFSVYDLVYSGAVSNERIAALKTVTGRTINKDAAASLRALKSGREEESRRILTGIPGISDALAAAILTSAKTLRQLCAYDRATIELIPVVQKTRTIKMGPARADKIWRFLRYRWAPPPEPGAAPPAVAAVAASAAPPPVVLLAPATSASALPPPVVLLAAAAAEEEEEAAEAAVAAAGKIDDDDPFLRSLLS